jgi:uncharacterized protein YdeI (YjbR/CyaY-like superfamily)
MVPLKRLHYPMPDSIRASLAARGLMNAYQAQPAYQRNDDIGWIKRAKREATRQKRLDQMLDKLERGGVYNNMKWQPK